MLINRKMQKNEMTNLKCYSDMIQVSKNYKRGEPITDPREILRLAAEKKPVIWRRGFENYELKPASFFLSWQLRLVLESEFFFADKIE